MSFAQIESLGVEPWLESLRTELRDGVYRPEALRRVWIPKTGGGQRPLGIPTIRDPEVLKNVFLDLASESSTAWGDPRLAPLADKLKLIDGSLLPALPRMHWALWLDEKNRAAKLHLKFKVLKQSACDLVITPGKCCEGPRSCARITPRKQGIFLSKQID